MACNHHQPGCFFTLDHIPDWTNNPSNSGQLKPSITGAFPVFHEFAPNNGKISAFANNAVTISQDVGTVKKGLIYDFSVEIGHVLDLGFGGSADVVLSRGHAITIIPAEGHMPGPGLWSTFTASFVGNPSNAGELITIQLKDSGRGNQGNFDSVVLTAVPEPSTLLLFGSGLLLLGIIAYRKQLHAKAGNTGLGDGA
jgi:hypothetical protein